MKFLYILSLYFHELFSTELSSHYLFHDRCSSYFTSICLHLTQQSFNKRDLIEIFSNDYLQCMKYEIYEIYEKYYA